MSTHTLSRLRIVLAALLFSTGGYAIKACGLTSWQVAGFRSGVAALAILMFLPQARRGWRLSSLLVGVGYAGTLICFVTANKLTTAANTIYLQSTAPLYILFLGPWLLREPVRPRDVALAAALAGGLALFFLGTEPARTSAPDPLSGNLLAILSGVFWALTLVGLRWMGRRDEGAAGVTAVAVGNLLAFLFCLPWALPIRASTGTDWVLIGYLGVFQIGLAYAFLTSALGRVPALEAALLLLIEPAFNPVWTWLGQGETPSGWAIAGGSVILGATAIKSWWDWRYPVARGQ